MTLSDHIGETNSIISTGYADVNLVFIPSIFSDMMDKLLKMLYIAIKLTNSTQYFLGHFIFVNTQEIRMTVMGRSKLGIMR
jgi:hypothetical protein